jgi:glycosyltransferase involved in cell wall biosynthesis
MGNAASMTTVAVLIVAYNGTKYLHDCLSSVLAANSDGLTVRVFVVDNAKVTTTDGEPFRNGFRLATICTF